MFGKLIKHELRHTARYHLAILSASLLATVIMGVSLLFDSTTLLDIAILPLMVIALAVIIVSLVSVIRNFYDTIFSKQGYLTMTLPVKGSSLLLSKVTVSFFWIIVSNIAAIVPFVFVILHAVKQFDGLDEAFREILSAYSDILPSTGSIVAIAVVYVLTSLISILSYVGYVYFSVTMANTRLLQRHPKIFGVLIFIAIHYIAGALSELSSKIATLNCVFTDEGVSLTFKSFNELGLIITAYNLNEYIITALLSLGLLFATGYVIEHKINIK